MTVLYVIIFAVVSQLTREALQQLCQSADWCDHRLLFKCAV